jgi:hypothetical protein
MPLSFAGQHSLGTFTGGGLGEGKVKLALRITLPQQVKSPSAHEPTVGLLHASGVPLPAQQA